MPRPRKCRKVCGLPQADCFVPLGDCRSLQNAVVLTVDEYEALRLIDYEGCMQEDCGRYMKVARTTVQQIYAAARKKVSCALVEGRPLKIEGGDYFLCDGGAEGCGGERHCKRRCPALESEARESAIGHEDNGSNE